MVICPISLRKCVKKSTLLELWRIKGKFYTFLWSNHIFFTCPADISVFKILNKFTDRFFVLFHFVVPRGEDGDQLVDQFSGRMNNLPGVDGREALGQEEGVHERHLHVVLDEALNHIDSCWSKRNASLESKLKKL